MERRGINLRDAHLRLSILWTVALSSALALALTAFGLTGARPAHAAATVTVNDTRDAHDPTPGDATCDSTLGANVCTLRAAIETADSNPGSTIVVGDHVAPANNGIYKLTLGTLPVVAAMAISGAGSASTIVDGAGAGGVFTVAADPSDTVSMSGLTVRGGQAPGGAGILGAGGKLGLQGLVVSGNATTELGVGGGILSVNPLTMAGVTVSGNHAGFGGGLAVAASPATITASTFGGNTANGGVADKVAVPGDGGGIFIEGFADFPSVLTLTGSTVNGNSAAGEQALGGGIFSVAGTMKLTNDTLNGNSAPAGVGGGILQAAPQVGARTTMSGTGPLQARAALATVLKAAVATLSQLKQAAAAARVAQVSQDQAVATGAAILDYVTLAKNSADTLGGIATDGGTFGVHSTIVANNAGGNCGLPGLVTSNGYNLETSTGCGFNKAGDQSGVADPKLNDLQVNPPGSTATMALQADSPAVDSADPASCPMTDQRGVTRPQGPRCDIGAFELEKAPTSPPPSPPVTGMGVTGSAGGGLLPIGVLLLVLVLVLALGTGLALRRSRSA